MLTSLFKIVLFLMIVVAIAFGATYLMDGDNTIIGDLMITLGGVEYTLSAIEAVIVLTLLVVLIWVVLKLLSLLVATLRFINGDDTAISRYFNRSRERRGYRALSEGMMALASGDANAAMTKAGQAERYLQQPTLTNLLAAQAAEMSGNTTRAEQIYKELIKDPQTRFVGVRGIMKQRLATGDTDVALKLAQKAFELKPNHEEVQDVLLQLQAKSHDWQGARKTLGVKLKQGKIPRDVHKRREAVLALSQAADVIDEENSIEKREAAIEANRLSPDLVPAAAMAAREYIAQGKPKLAVRVIKKAWESQPHPDLAAAFSEIAPNETPQERLKRFAQLSKLNPDHIETRLMMAELNLAAEDFPEARRALGDIVENEPDARALTIMAAIERGEGSSDEVVRGWLTKALSAPRGPQWVCDKCNTIHSDWVPVCSSCDVLDTLSWKEAPQNEMQTSTGIEMLPLLMGANQDEMDEGDLTKIDEPAMDQSQS
ncbi:MAG: heme biosynthesis HemY N-terminal domain-containing protein [Paracoccaceae bacterium]|jgi:HemY protein